MQKLSWNFHEFFYFLFFIFCQENFMKNLLGKFHAEIVMEFS